MTIIAWLGFGGLPLWGILTIFIVHTFLDKRFFVEWWVKTIMTSTGNDSIWLKIVVDQVFHILVLMLVSFSSIKPRILNNERQRLIHKSLTLIYLITTGSSSSIVLSFFYLALLLYSHYHSPNPKTNIRKLTQTEVEKDHCQPMFPACPE